MTILKLKSTLFFLVSLSTAVASAQVPGKYQIDSAHSNINFAIRHLMSKVTGRFDRFTGTAAIGQSTLADSQFAVEIDTASLYTGVVARDDHLRTKDFFEVATFPKATFRSKALKALGADHYELTGDFTLKGITKPVTFTLQFLGKDLDAQGNEKQGFRATGTIKRSDFGITYNSLGRAGTLVIGDDVELLLYVQLKAATN